jgi:hypothetical protein
MKKLVLLFSIFLLCLLPIKSFAQEFNVVQSNEEFKDANDDAIGNNGFSSSPNNVYLISSSINTWAAFVNGSDYLTDQYADKFRSLGLIQQASNLNLAILSTPPANTAVAVYDIGRTLGFVTEKTYAQSTGFSGLSPLINIWRLFRNMAYVLLSVALIIVAFMIMFRSKIDPHTVITVQAALPRVAVALILITFSYAIAGLLIDLMYVLLFMAHALFTSAGLPGARPGLFGEYTTREAFTTGNLLQAVGAVFPGGIIQYGQIAQTILGINTEILSGVAGGIVLGIVGFFTGGIGGALVTGGLGAGAGFIAGPALGALIIGIFVLILIVRLFFVFLGAYVQIILAVVFSPIQILMGIIPGNKGFESWFRTIAGNLAVFVVAGIMFMLATLFIFQTEDAVDRPIWAPPYVGIVQSTTNAIGALFALGVLMMIPPVASNVRQKIIGQSGGGVAVGSALNLGVPMSIGSAAVGYLIQRGFHQRESRRREQQGQMQAPQKAAPATGKEEKH